MGLRQHVDMIKKHVFLLLAFLSAPLLPGAAALPHPYRILQPEDAPQRLLAVIEIPSGSAIKYEIHPETGHVFVDRFLSMPVHYPTNYGSLPSLMAVDGDPLDVLVLSRIPIAPGALIEVRPIGLLRMKDGGEADDKFIAVPTTDVDPHYRDIADVSDLSEHERLEIEYFFAVYKQLPKGGKTVVLDGFDGADIALERLEAVLDAPD